METNHRKHQAAISVVIPVYNEEKAIAETIHEIDSALRPTSIEYEIIAVNDGSNDGTQKALQSLSFEKLKVFHHNRNKGYGAALKTGIRGASNPVIVITDADGTYPNARIPDLVGMLKDNEMVVGARTGKNAKIPLVRRPAKWLIGKLANYLARYKIPDINSGLRVFTREAALEYQHILPDGFSFTTTITLAMLTLGKEVEYTPIAYGRRTGRSKIKPIRDTLNFVQLIIRTILLFEPLRIFVPVASLLFLSGCGVLAYSWAYMPKVMDMTTTLLFVSALQILGIGMIADMINRRLRG